MDVATRFRAPSDGRGLPHPSALEERAHPADDGRRGPPGSACWPRSRRPGRSSPRRGATAADVPEDAPAAPGPGRAVPRGPGGPTILRCHGGDGLGPLYNATSCLDCHPRRAAGPGARGRGPERPDRLARRRRAVPRRDPRFLAAARHGVTRQPRSRPHHHLPLRRAAEPPSKSRALATIHPGFRRGRSLVLHRDATDPVAYAAFPGGASLGRRGLENGLALLRTERNTPPLFGLRLIDEAPNAVIGDNARRQSRRSGARVHTLDGGAIGRFGWKRGRSGRWRSSS